MALYTTRQATQLPSRSMILLSREAGNCQLNSRASGRFQDPMTGVSAMNNYQSIKLGYTTDGGKTWDTSNAKLQQFRPCNIDFVGNEYRMLAFDPYSLTYNSQFYFSSNGTDWTQQPPVP